MISARLVRLSAYVAVVALALTLAIVGLARPVTAKADTAITSVDLSRYVLVGRYDLPEPTRTQATPRPSHTSATGSSSSARSGTARSTCSPAQASTLVSLAGSI
jgi:hypothetical protein